MSGLLVILAIPILAQLSSNVAGRADDHTGHPCESPRWSSSHLTQKRLLQVDGTESRGGKFSVFLAFSLSTKWIKNCKIFPKFVFFISPMIYWLLKNMLLNFQIFEFSDSAILANKLWAKYSLLNIQRFSLYLSICPVLENALCTLVKYILYSWWITVLQLSVKSVRWKKVFKSFISVLSAELLYHFSGVIAVYHTMLESSQVLNCLFLLQFC